MTGQRTQGSQLRPKRMIMKFLIDSQQQPISCVSNLQPRKQRIVNAYVDPSLVDMTIVNQALLEKIIVIRPKNQTARKVTSSPETTFSCAHHAGDERAGCPSVG